MQTAAATTTATTQAAATTTTTIVEATTAAVSAAPIHPFTKTTITTTKKTTTTITTTLRLLLPLRLEPSAWVPPIARRRPIALATPRRVLISVELLVAVPFPETECLPRIRRRDEPAAAVALLRLPRHRRERHRQDFRRSSITTIPTIKRHSPVSSLRPPKKDTLPFLVWASWKKPITTMHVLP